ncbi:MAG: ABC transporter permease [Nitriliruptoraceae bacterium]|nr:ABC transporter permease [Nitriliruptoraceae bacterium]
MAVFILRRFIISTFTLLAASFVVYFGVSISGDPFEDLRGIQDEGDAQIQIAARRELLQLDVPVPLRWFNWLTGIFRGDFGLNIRNQDVSALLSNAAAATMQMVIVATVLAIVLGVTVGIVSALRQYSGFDYSLTFAAFLFYSLPVFWVAVMLKQYAAIEFNNWLRDPTISPTVTVVVALLAAVAWQALIGGDRQRRLVVSITSFASTAAVLVFFSTTRWFADPGFGTIVVGVMSVISAVVATYLTAGFRHRPPLQAAGATAVAGVGFYLVGGPILAEPSAWTLLGLFVLGIGAALGIGAGLGGIHRRQAMSASALTAVLVSGVIFMDQLLQAYERFFGLVRGRPISTVGSATPGFTGNFWEVGLDSISHLMLPTVALLLISFAVYTRYTRASMLEVMNQDYIRTARAKGLTERTVVMRHGFRNALIPVTTLMAFDFGAVIGGAVITEQVFGWQGMGTLFIRGLNEVDPNPVMAFFVVAGGSIVVFNMIADIAYAYLDPRIRLS